MAVLSLMVVFLIGPSRILHDCPQLMRQHSTQLQIPTPQKAYLRLAAFVNRVFWTCELRRGSPGGRPSPDVARTPNPLILSPSQHDFSPTYGGAGEGHRMFPLSPAIVGTFDLVTPPTYHHHHE